MKKRKYSEPEFELFQLTFSDDLMDLTLHSRTETSGTEGDLSDGGDDIDLG